MTAIDFNILVRCAKLSLVAYHDEPSHGIDAIKPIELLDKKCWLFMDDNSSTLYIVFRGSDSTLDLLNNLNFVPKQYKNYGKVHSGYFHYYASVQRNIIEYIQDNRKTIKKIVTTGHSAGSSSAVFTSLDIHEFGKSTLCITFGSPPFCDQEFADVQNKLVPQTYRVANVEDFAPRLPLPGLVHAGKPILLCNSPTSCEVQVPMIPTKIVNSHGMARYVACLYQSRKFQRPLAMAKFKFL